MLSEIKDMQGWAGGSHHFFTGLVGDACVGGLEDHVANRCCGLSRNLANDSVKLTVLNLSLLGPGCEVTSFTVQAIVGEG